jgi:putative cardiolipin synthase
MKIHWLRGLFRLLILVVLGGGVALVLAAPAPFATAKPRSIALPSGNDAPLDLLALADPAGTTRVRLSDENLDAFALRWFAAEMAVRSIDVQTYIWHEDRTGGLIAGALLRAADRGVRVRVLVDDMDARPKTDLLATADLHPQVEVRVWNPFRFSSGALRTGVEMLWRGGRLNRRMHNKSFVVDHRLAIVGGRNLGDEYFGADPQVSFTDLDVGLLGSAANDASDAFDRYWNHPAAVPLTALRRAQPMAGGLPALREILEGHRTSPLAKPYLDYVAANPAFADSFTAAPTFLLAAEKVVLWCDDPAKVEGVDRAALTPGVFEGLLAAFAAAETSLDIVSPYFVPGDQGAQGLVDRVRDGVVTRVLTNSLAANDVAAVHGGYSRYRERLLRGGVQLFELMPKGEVAAAQSLFGSSHASLHTKAAMIDRRRLFVGSFNLDPRSALTNTEMGVLIDEPRAAERLRLRYEAALVDRVWQLGIDPLGITWTRPGGVGGAPRREDPQASLTRRWTALLARRLPVESLL